MTTLRDLSLEYKGRIAPEDFTVLSAFVLGKTKEFVFREPDHVLSSEQDATLRPILDRRTGHEPVAYILGEREFFGLPFFVTKDTLIPRPETEHLVEEALESLSRHSEKTAVIDIGTGSGAIIISVAHKLFTDRPEDIRHEFTAIDLFLSALTVAKRNATRHDVLGHITFLEGNLLSPITEIISDDTGRILILANLPYLSQTLYESAPADVRLHEPFSALVADDEGLSLYTEVLDDIMRRKQDGWKNTPIDGFFEISPEQESSLERIFIDRFPTSEHSFLPDLSGRTRVFLFHIRYRE